MSHLMCSASYLPMRFKERMPICRAQRAAPLQCAKADPSNPDAWRPEMKMLARFFAARREGNLTTAMERKRLGMTMPGQTGALAAARLGYLVN